MTVLCAVNVCCVPCKILPSLATCLLATRLRLIQLQVRHKQNPQYILDRKKRLYDLRKSEAEDKLQRKKRGTVGGYKDAAVDKLYPDGGAAVIPAAAAKTGSPRPHCGSPGHKTSRTGTCSSHGECLAKCNRAVREGREEAELCVPQAQKASPETCGRGGGGRGHRTPARQSKMV